MKPPAVWLEKPALLSISTGLVHSAVFARPVPFGDGNASRSRTRAASATLEERVCAVLSGRQRARSGLIFWSSSVRARPAPPLESRCSRTGFGRDCFLLTCRRWALMCSSSGTDLARTSSRTCVRNAGWGTGVARRRRPDSRGLAHHLSLPGCRLPRVMVCRRPIRQWCT